ncbi:FtsW/RodA/SpoVE family cell cycle protein [Aquirufa nivalisilvae]|uniref:Probable peptidoglycan glycosyltransferase FtsW n=1 Tax=Aquirufa nivalisilvae TaxID=2516557 RepID=A0A2S2DT51_9BACT|nr:FtsW/RodA/SpoVE family cell cycle protein [Aquirufa nivalisilvae]AWL08482.1 Cell division protein FtsW like protein [Aquirufa nivalisilvae]MCZ2478952.1 FtsW/RodA/SpoVE family cell cycle protein [Aquirufa nivalisilvae]MCZ2483381.1 FtsW/RodA/SpoVE family cell cycle protein [Aquirufa nivalisilvae]TBH75882.1 cell division protein FtsW [Aquirufa nivalisilvae]
MENRISEFIKSKLAGDYQIWFIVFVLNAFGLLIQFSAKGRMVMMNPMDPILSFIKSLVILTFSFIMMSWFSRQNYLKFAQYSHIALIFSWMLILFAFIFGESKGGASRWLEIGPISFMPSDMAKLCLIGSLSKDFSTRQSNPEAYNWQFFLWLLIKIGITCFLIMLSNFSTSILIFLTSIILMIFGRVPWKQIGYIIASVAILASLVVTLEIGQRAKTVKARIANFSNRVGKKDSKSVDKKDEDYQLYRSYYAIATGALSPKGPGRSQQRYFLSQAESDFVYAIIVEEYGIVVAIFIPLFFLWLMYRGANAVRHSGKPFGGLLSAGLTFSIVFQAFINMLVAVGAGPVTGQPMPMVSAGGTSLIFTAISIGLILSVSRDKEQETKDLKTII